MKKCYITKLWGTPHRRSYSLLVTSPMASVFPSLPTFMTNFCSEPRCVATEPLGMLSMVNGSMRVWFYESRGLSHEWFGPTRFPAALLGKEQQAS